VASCTKILPVLYPGINGLSTIARQPLIVKLATTSLCSQKIQHCDRDQLRFEHRQTKIEFYDNFVTKSTNRSPLCPDRSIIAIESHSVNDIINTVKFIETEKEKIEACVISVTLLIDAEFAPRLSRSQIWSVMT